jgi:N-carbamoyl-L-amino-acid hydrolase
VSGSLEVDNVRTLKDKQGTALPDAIAADGIDLDRIMDAGSIIPRLRAYAELHIEQGPVLEAEGLRLGAVTGTMGVERHRFVLVGQNAHAGATPLHLRRDTTLAAARMAFRDIARAREVLCTVGAFAVSPGVPTVVNGRTEFTIDCRSLDQSRLRAAVAEMMIAADDIARDENVELASTVIWQIPPMPFEPSLIDEAERIVGTLTGVPKRMPSGPLHDAAEMARAGVPTIMFFTPSINGLSHTHIEDTSEPDLALGIDAFGQMIEHLTRWVAERSPA